jgi:hypothetical protein
MALAGGIALLAPMTLMVLHKDLATALVTVAVAVLLFAVRIAYFPRPGSAVTDCWCNWCLCGGGVGGCGLEYLRPHQPPPLHPPHELRQFCRDRRRRFLFIYLFILTYMYKQSDFADIVLRT